MGLLVLVRHGQSLWNLENRFTGWVDVPLTQKGISEAEKAGQVLKEYHFDIAYTSMLTRAQHTLNLINPNLSVIKDIALNERHYGDLQGLNKDQAKVTFGEEQVRLWRRSYDVPPPQGESLKDTAARTLPFFERCILGDIKQGKNVLVVAHGNSNRSIIMQLDSLTKEQVIDLELATGIPIIYKMNNEGKILNKKTIS